MFTLKMKHETNVICRVFLKIYPFQIFLFIQISSDLGIHISMKKIKQILLIYLFPGTKTSGSSCKLILARQLKMFLGLK